MFYGYHFTTIENWIKIQKIGYIEPYEIKNDVTKLPFSTKGIWLWQRLLTREELLGCCIYQFFKKGSLEFILLKVPYTKTEGSILFGEPGMYYLCEHNYVDVSLNLHKNVPAIIKLNKIFLEDITVEDKYDFLDCIPRRIPHKGEILKCR